MPMGGTRSGERPCRAASSVLRTPQPRHQFRLRAPATSYTRPAPSLAAKGSSESRVPYLTLPALEAEDASFASVVALSIAWPQAVYQASHSVPTLRWRSSRCFLPQSCRPPRRHRRGELTSGALKMLMKEMTESLARRGQPAAAAASTAPAAASTAPPAAASEHRHHA